MDIWLVLEFRVWLNDEYENRIQMVPKYPSAHTQIQHINSINGSTGSMVSGSVFHLICIVVFHLQFVTFVQFEH